MGVYEPVGQVDGPTAAACAVHLVAMPGPVPDDGEGEPAGVTPVSPAYPNKRCPAWRVRPR